MSMEKMKAAVFMGNGKLEFQERDIPGITKDDDVIIKVEACSICGTDVHIMSVPPGYIATPGTILGHELCGEIVKTGSGVSNVKAGDRVVVNPNDYCGTCDYCVNGLPNHCVNIKAMGIHVDGGFAEYVRTSAKMVHKISSELPMKIAVFAEPLACAVNGINKINVKPAEKVLVIGGGPIGLLMVQLMKASGADVVCSEPNETRRGFALKSGADHVVDPMKEDVAEFVNDKLGKPADVVIDVVGSQIETAIKSVRRGGRILLFGVNTKAVPQIVQSDIIFKEVAILGTWLANSTFPRAVEILESGVLDLDCLVTDVMPLDELESGIDKLRSGNGIEIIITI